MGDIYGELTEHPEYPVEDERRFTVAVRVHDFDLDLVRRHGDGRARCWRCGFPELSGPHTRREP